MAITTMAGAQAGLSSPRVFTKNPNISKNNVLNSYWTEIGNPVAGSENATLNGVTLSSSSAQVTGQIDFRDPASGNTYLGRFSASMRYSGLTGKCGLILADRLWHNGGFTITSTSAQAITSPTWPARDAAGGTSGVGVFLGLEISSTTGAATPTVTVSYTNTAGTAGQTGTNIIPTQVSTQTGSFIPIGLQAGDIGVQSVQSLTLNASWVSGTMNLVAFRPIAMLTPAADGFQSQIDSLTSGFPQLFNGSVPFLIGTPNDGNGTVFVSATFNWTQG